MAPARVERVAKHKGGVGDMTATSKSSKKAKPARTMASTRPNARVKVGASRSPSPVLAVSGRDEAGVPGAANDHPAEPVSAREAQRLATREAIIHAAAEGFARLGYDQCSLEEIAGTAGVSKGLLLYHFNSKDELLTAVENKVFDGLLTYIKSNTASVGPSVDQALWALDRAWELITSSRDFLSIYLQSSLRARNATSQAEGAGAFYSRHRQVLVEGAATTLGPLVKSLPVDLESLADILLSTLFGLAIARMQAEDPAKIDRSYASFRNVLKLAMGLK